MEPRSAVQKSGTEDVLLKAKMHRRQFLFFTGTAAASAALFTACNKDEDTTTINGGIDLGRDDIGILNYAYALEQLEAAFYTQVMATPYANMAALEAEYLKDIRDHEVAHREFFKAALGSNAIQGLEVDFSKIDFTKRDSVLATAKAFEDLGVAAYNGAGKLITNPAYLLVAGKIVSVEARHAALIRDLITPGTFADSTTVDANGLDVAMKPNDVLMTANTFLKTKVSANNLPTT